jgi:hypothetical protein
VASTAWRGGFAPDELFEIPTTAQKLARSQRRGFVALRGHARWPRNSDALALCSRA